MQAEALIRIQELRKHFPVKRGGFPARKAWLKAVEGVSFDIRRGQVVGLVGESGSGKSTLGRLLLRLLEATAGEVTFDGASLHRMRPTEMKRFRRRAQMIFQDPYSSLNRYLTVEETLSEPLQIHRLHGSRGARRERIVAILEQVGLGPEALGKYPHEFSGGQRQRIGIARALILEPEFVVADEPVSALDVSVQAQVLNILFGLRRDMALTMIFITHDLAVVRQIADRIVVLYLGRVMEIAPVEQLFQTPAHPYTQALLAAAPSIDLDAKRPDVAIAGEIPNPLDPPRGCPFQTRCPFRVDACAAAPMTLEPVREDQSSACIRSAELSGASAAA